MIAHSQTAVRGPKLWNKVPSDVKAERTFDSFKTSLSKFLALIPDNPPVSGYTCSWSNSGRLYAFSVVRHLMTVPAARINLTQVTQVSEETISYYTQVMNSLLRKLYVMFE